MSHIPKFGFPLLWSKVKMSKTKTVHMSKGRSVENESIWNEKPPSPSPSLLYPSIVPHFYFRHFYLSTKLGLTEIWRCEQISRRGCDRFPLEMYHLLQKCASPALTSTSPTGDTASPGRDVFASSNRGVCDTAESNEAFEKDDSNEYRIRNMLFESSE